MMEKGNITYSSLGKVLKNNKNKIEDAGKNKEKRIKHVAEKQTKALQTLSTYPQLKQIRDLFLKDLLTLKTEDESKKIKKMEWEIDRDDLIHKTSNKKKSKTYNFQKSKKIRSFERKIYSAVVTLTDAFEE